MSKAHRQAGTGDLNSVLSLGGRYLWEREMAATYAKDIRPLFRPQDIACMSKAGVGLGDAAWMCDPAGNHGFADHGNARHVYTALEKGVMPPDKKWSQQALDTYKAWMNDGFAPGS